MNTTFTNFSTSTSLNFVNRIKACLKIVVVLISFGIGISSIKAQPIKQWDNTLGGDSYEYLYSGQQTTDGGYILGGTSHSNVISGDKSQNGNDPYSNDYWLVKLNAAGAKEWDKTIGGNTYESLQSVQQTADGGYILAGFSYSNASGDKSENSKGDDDYWIVKLNAAGVKEWDKTIGGSMEDRLYSIQQTADGGYILGGNSNSNAGGDKSESSRGYYDYWVVKLNANGNKEWDKTLGGNNGEEFKSVRQATDGGYIVGGISTSSASGDKSSNPIGSSIRDFWLIKLNAVGSIEWEKTIGGSGVEANGTFEPTPDGGFILGGGSYSNISGDKSENSKGGSDYWLVKLNRLGIKEWDKTIGGSGGEGIKAIQVMADGGYILGGLSDSNLSGDKSENSKGGFDYWLVKVNKFGNREWDKTIGGNNEDQLSFIDHTTDGGYVLGGTSNSTISGDKSEKTIGTVIYDATDYWVVKLSAAPAPCTATGTILREQWNNVAGTSVSVIPVNTTPTSTSQLTSFEAPSNIGSSYGARIRGYICAPQTGAYTFWIAGDNDCELWLSTDENPADKVKIASVVGYTGVRQWSVYSSQKSVLINLVANKRYYVEALHKENSNGDNVAVGWKTPGSTTITVVPGAVLSPVTTTSVPNTAPVVSITSPTSGGTFTAPATISIMANATDVGGSVAKVEFFRGTTKLGEDFTAPYTYFWTGVAAGTYSLTAKATDNLGLSSTSTPISVSIASTTTTCVATGTILREQWNNVTGTSVSVIPVNTPPSSTSQLTMLEAPSNVGSSYGARIRGYICAPQSGNYTFWVAGDNDCELWLSTDANPANKVKIAGLVGYTAVREWNKYASQKSALIKLEANKRYYVEVLHKENSNGDNVAVSWQLPTGILEAPIAGTRLSPFIVNSTSQLVSAAKPESEIATIKATPVFLKASPNPFSKVTTIQFSLPAPEMATLQVYNLNGRLLQTLHRGAVEKDRLYSYELSGDSLASGVYLCRLVYGKTIRYERLVVIK